MTTNAGLTAVATGGDHGTGAAIARMLAEHGARVAMLDVDGAAACVLTGPDAWFVTGQTVDVAGGWLMT